MLTGSIRKRALEDVLESLTVNLSTVVASPHSLCIYNRLVSLVTTSVRFPSFGFCWTRDCTQNQCTKVPESAIPECRGSRPSPPSPFHFVSHSITLRRVFLPHGSHHWSVLFVPGSSGPQLTSSSAFAEGSPLSRSVLTVNWQRSLPSAPLVVFYLVMSLSPNTHKGEPPDPRNQGQTLVAMYMAMLLVVSWR